MLTGPAWDGSSLSFSASWTTRPIKEGFDFKYGLEEIYDQTVEYFKAKGLLQN